MVVKLTKDNLSDIYLIFIASIRRCPGRAAVEVTHVVSTDRVGNVYLSESMEKAMPPAQHWNEIRT